MKHVEKQRRLVTILNGLIKNGRAYEIGQKHAHTHGVLASEVRKTAVKCRVFSTDQAQMYKEYVAGILDYEDGMIRWTAIYPDKKSGKAIKKGYHPPHYANFPDDCLGDYA